jgi:hypothetical protein
LVKQAKERQEREAQERLLRRDLVMDTPLQTARSTTSSVDSKLNKPKDKQKPEKRAPATFLPPDTTPTPVEVARKKLALGVALKEQIKLKRANQKDLRASAVMQERFFLDCIQDELRADRKQRLQHKADVRESLRSEWGKQQRAAGLQKILQDANNGRLSNGVDELLQGRSSSASVAGSSKGSVTGRKLLQY